jgi:diacylglycerol kinase (ATP)
LKTLVLHNPRAGRCTPRALDALRGALLRESGGDDVDRLETGPGPSWRESLSGYGRVVILGGDGTVHAALPELIRSRAELWVLPGGSANDLCAALGLSQRASEAAALLMEGENVEYDVIEVNGRPVITGGGFGLGYRAAASANRLREGALRPVARRLRDKIYLATLGWHGLAAPPPRTGYRVEAEGLAWEGVTQSLLFCNQSVMGRNVKVAPGTSGVDGRFQLVRVLHATAREILGALIDLKRDPRSISPRIAKLDRAEVTRAIVTFDRPVPAYGDGELFPAASRWELVCRPGAVRLRRPQIPRASRMDGATP